MQLGGRTALVTGASRGIGAAVCRAYAAEGAVVIAAHHPSAAATADAQRLVAELARSGSRAFALAADLANTANCDDLVKEATRQAGPIDVLVCNAAVSAGRPWRQQTDEEWQDIFDVNIAAAYHLSKAVYENMAAGSYGKIITVSSGMVATGQGGDLAYVTSKAGLVGMTRALAREVGHAGIRVNCIMPGAIRTEAEVELYPDAAAYASRVLALQSLPIVAEAADITGPFVFFASSLSDFVTGQVLLVDGGWACW
jgi:3-oxoacyl-[acyl-carrier protein] reductase